MQQEEYSLSPLDRLAKGGTTKLRIFGPPKSHYDQEDGVPGSVMPFIIEVAAPLPQVSKVAGAVVAAGLSLGNAGPDYVGPGATHPTLGVSGQPSRMREALKAMDCDDVAYVAIDADTYARPDAAKQAIKDYMREHPLDQRIPGRG
jgi:hypothetical protein